MNYVVHTNQQLRQLRQQIYAQRGIGLLEIETIKVDPQGIKWSLNLTRAFQNNEYSMLDYVKEMITLDVIIFFFGGYLIQYTPRDLLKVIEKFDDCIWVKNEVERQELIRFIKMQLQKQHSE